MVRTRNSGLQGTDPSILKGGRPRKYRQCRFCGVRLTATELRDHAGGCRIEQVAKMQGKYVPLLCGKQGAKIRVVAVNRQTLSFEPRTPETKHMAAVQIPLKHIFEINRKEILKLSSAPKLRVSTHMPAQLRKRLASLLLPIEAAR